MKRRRTTAGSRKMYLLVFYYYYFFYQNGPMPRLSTTRSNIFKQITALDDVERTNGTINRGKLSTRFLHAVHSVSHISVIGIHYQSIEMERTTHRCYTIRPRQSVRLTSVYCQIVKLCTKHRLIRDCLTIRFRQYDAPGEYVLLYFGVIHVSERRTVTRNVRVFPNAVR